MRGHIRVPFGAIAMFAGASHAAAQQSKPPSDAGQIQDIIVTAQRRGENLQKSALVVQAIDGEALRRASVTDATALTTLVPGLQIGTSSTNTQIYLRGVGDPSTNVRQNPGVAFNVDGVYVARPAAVAATFFDLERIEVLKGPQGTLYGRNASGGAINVLTKQPTLDGVYGDANLEGGNYDLIHFSGAVNVPVSGDIAVRVATDIVNRKGYLSDGSNDDRHEAVRAQILFAPSDVFKLTLRADFANIHGKGAGFVYLPQPGALKNNIGSTDPAALAYLQSRAANDLLGLAGGNAAAAQGLAQGYATGVRPLGIVNRLFNVSAEMNADLGWATLTIIPAYRYFDSDNTNYFGSYNRAIAHSREATLEARLGHDGAGNKWVAGVYVFDEQIKGSNEIALGDIQTGFVTFSRNPTLALAAFAQDTLSLTNRFRLTAGGRFTHERVRLAGRSDSSFFGQPSGYDFGGKVDFSSFTWKAGAEYDLTSQNLLTFSASTGFKAGGLNQTVGSFSAYRPEKLTAFEIQSKNRFLNDRLQINGELFWWDYRDRQASFLTFDPGVQSYNILTKNSGKATIRGFFAEVLGRPTSADTVRVNVEHNDATFDNFVVQAANVVPGVTTSCSVGPPGPTGTSAVDCSGFPLDHAPRWTASASWTHKFTFGSGAIVSITPSVQWTDSRWGANDYTSNEFLPSFLNGSFDVEYVSADKRRSVGAYVHNFTDAHAAQGGTLVPFVPSVFAANVLAPRTFGGRIGYSF